MLSPDLNANYSVLIVDDEPDIHAIIKLTLKSVTINDRQLTFASAYSKADALNALKSAKQPFSLIYLDVIMENDQAGFELLDAIQELNLAVMPQIIMVTGQAGQFDEQYVTAHFPINGYLSKGELSYPKLLSLTTMALRNFDVIQCLEHTSQNLSFVQQQQQNINNYMSSVLNALTDALIVVNSKGIMVSSNPAAAQMFSYPQDELIAQPVEMLIPEPYAAKHKVWVQNYHGELSNKLMGKGRELLGLKKNGLTFPMEITLSEFVSDGERQYLCLIRDITERLKTQREIYRLAYFDSVTGLPNLDSFYKHLNQDISNQNHDIAYVQLALIDLSGFYRINQAYGHDVGDNLLTLLVDRIEWVLPKKATLYRSDGSDFIIRFTTQRDDMAAAKNELRQIVEQIFEAINQPITLGTSHHQITANVGVLVAKPATLATEKVIHELEFATAHAKQLADLNWAFYDVKLEQQANYHYQLEQALTKAIDNNELSLVLQPQFDSNNRIQASEALLRWNNPQLGFIPPDVFIEIAEQSGLIVAIGRWVLDQCCQCLNRALEQGIRTHIAINISARELLQPDFAETVIAKIHHYRLQPSQLTIEITERVLATDIETVKLTMQLLADAGIRFSIDDFGTGYSSLSYLKWLPIDELKIDKSFTDDIGMASEPVPLVDTIINMAQSLHLNVVTEGVENESQRHYLMQHQGMLIQGYLMSKPLPFEQWLELIKQQPI